MFFFFLRNWLEGDTVDTTIINSNNFFFFFNKIQPLLQVDIQCDIFVPDYWAFRYLRDLHVLLLSRQLCMNLTDIFLRWKYKCCRRFGICWCFRNGANYNCKSGLWASVEQVKSADRGAVCGAENGDSPHCRRAASQVKPLWLLSGFEKWYP